MKVVYNSSYGGFGLSIEAIVEMHKRGSKALEEVSMQVYFGSEYDNNKDLMTVDLGDGYMTDDGRIVNNVVKNGMVISYGHSPDEQLRADPVLVAVVEEMGEKANGRHAKLVIKEISDYATFKINEYDGSESVEVTDQVIIEKTAPIGEHCNDHSCPEYKEDQINAAYCLFCSNFRREDLSAVFKNWKLVQAMKDIQ